LANRLSLLRRADVILILDKGWLLQTGTHEQTNKTASVRIAIQQCFN